MRSDRWKALAMALVVALVACEGREAGVEEEAPTDTVDHEAAIDDLRAGYESAYNAGDVDGLLGYYDEDFLEYTPAATMDYAGVTAALRDSAGIPPGAQLSITTEDLMVAEAGDLAYGTGTTSFSATAPDGTPMTGNDRWLAVFRNVDGEWKLHRLAILPAVGATTADEGPTDTMPADTAATM